MRYGRLWVIGFVAVLSVGAACAVNPVTGERQLVLISESQEIQMGRDGAAQVEQSIGLIDDDALQAFVRNIGNRMAAASERPNLPWSFGVVDDATPNAFALPGGFIYVTRGLMALMDSEAELAAVLGHEIGHVTARHSVTAMSRAQLATLTLGVGMIVFPDLGDVGQLAGAGLGLLFLKYGRDAENQADELGFRYALEQGYDVREMADVFLSLQRVGEMSGQSPIPSWLSTHPDPGNRIENVNARVANLGRSLDGTVINRPVYLDHVDGLVYGQNPRNGFFEGSAFLHPDLRFRLDFPSGWQAQNLPNSVSAVSGQQDALIELTLVSGAEPDAAARDFFGQTGISAGTTSRQSVNGNDAVGGYFNADTQQGVLRGYALFIGYDGRTYRLLGYSAQSRFTQYDRTMRESMESFRQLTEPAALNRQPDRIRIVRPGQALTLSQFAQRYPSSVSIDLLALLNQLDGPESTLAASQPAKQIVAGG